MTRRDAGVRYCLAAAALAACAPNVGRPAPEPAAAARAELRPRAERARSPEALREVVGELLGRLGRIRSIHTRGTVEIAAAGIRGEIEGYSARPARMWNRTSLGAVGDITTGFDGQTGWIVNPATGLRRGLRYVQQSAAGSIPVDNLLDDYRPFGGLMIPTRVVQRTPTVTTVQTTTLVEFDTAPDSVFALPPAVKALAGK